MEDIAQNSKFIDIDRIIQNKNPRLYRWLPAFCIRYLKKIIHQDEINQIIKENIHLLDEDFCKDIVKRFGMDLKVHGLHHIPPHESCIFVSNHPLGGIDALAIVSVVSSIRNDIRFIVNDLLLHLKSLSNMFVGVNKHGRSPRQAMEGVNELFMGHKAIFIFPAGMVSRWINGKVDDLEWKKTFVTQALKHNKKVIPVHISGALSPFFYRLHRLRSLLGIKINIEMLYLVDEMFKQKGKTIHLYFGKPIVCNTLPMKNQKEIAAHIKKLAYDLPKEYPTEHH
jgi:putative hemolysin